MSYSSHPIILYHKSQCITFHISVQADFIKLNAGLLLHEEDTEYAQQRQQWATEMQQMVAWNAQLRASLGLARMRSLTCILSHASAPAARAVYSWYRAHSQTRATTTQAQAAILNATGATSEEDERGAIHENAQGPKPSNEENEDKLCWKGFTGAKVEHRACEMGYETTGMGHAQLQRQFM